jgi:hypothetical protein
VELQLSLSGADGVLGTVDARYADDENPFGMNPDDPRDRTTS